MLFGQIWRDTTYAIHIAEVLFYIRTAGYAAPGGRLQMIRDYRVRRRADASVGHFLYPLLPTWRRRGAAAPFDRPNAKNGATWAPRSGNIIRNANHTWRRVLYLNCRISRAWGPPPSSGAQLYSGPNRPCVDRAFFEPPISDMAPPRAAAPISPPIAKNGAL